ncbi:enoyl-CoA hydratase/isomerase family protein [Spirosoma lituiforme]
MVVQFSEYADRYPNLKMERRDGILQVTLHEKGNSFLITDQSHRDLGYAFADIGADRENKVVILTGAGDSFMAGARFSDPSSLTTSMGVDTLYWEGRQLLLNLLDIEVPVIAAVNGPVNIHSDVPLLCDIVLTSETATFHDSAHFTAGLVPADGLQVIWPLAIGLTRAKYFLLTGQTLTAQQAKQYGAVNEVLPADKLLARAWEHAERLAALPNLTRRYTRVVVTQRLKSEMLSGMGYGLALEGLAMVALNGQ